jgi:hypothetical protein
LLIQLLALKKMILKRYSYCAEYKDDSKQYNLITLSALFSKPLITKGIQITSCSLRYLIIDK